MPSLSSAPIAALLGQGAVGLCSVFTGARLSVLIFHRVLARADELLPSEPDAERFEALMRFVARAYRVLTLGEAVSLLTQGRLPRRSLVITFDDGYADNAQVALPILLRHGLRATFFVSSGFLDGGRMWNDTVIECLRACRHSSLDLADFGLGRHAVHDAADRRQLIAVLLPRIKYLRAGERDEAVARLQRLCGAATLPQTLMMRSAEVRSLHAVGMEIGGHTVTHPILTTLLPRVAEDEIGRGREDLQALIDAPVDVFAFPNGKPDVDYDSSHVEIVRRLGFRGAVSTAVGAARAGDDPFQLPRFTPWARTLPMWATRLVINQRTTRYAVVADAAGA